MLKENVPSLLHFIDDSKLRQPEWQTTLFGYFEGKVLSSLAMRLQYKTKTERQSSLVAWNDCLDHVSLLAECHTERVLLEAFINGI